MQINFTKMHGLGNDFVVIDAINQSFSLAADQIKHIADRNFGIGCDQVLLVENSNVSDADFRYRIYNADGSEAEQCGNGARCFAQFIHDNGLSNKTNIPVVTSNGRIILTLQGNGNVLVDMGAPRLEPQQIPFVSNEQNDLYKLELDGQTVEFSTVSMGNPHAVITVDDIDSAPVEQLGKAFQQNPHFPESVNVGFMQIIDPQHIKLRVYERSVGETKACGSGACAAVVAGKKQGVLSSTVDAKLLGGNLSIHWAGDQNPVMMSGPTATVFKGTITL